EFGGERSELVPGAVFHVDAALGSLLRAHVFDFAGIEYARTAGGGRCGFEIACEIRHPLFELGERPERCHVEHRHEATVVVPAARLDTETQPSEQTTQHLDHRREPAALVALGAAHRQQRATLAQLRRVGGLPAVLVDDPPGRDFLAACDRQIDLAGRDRGRRHVQTKGTVEVGRNGDRDRVSAEPRLAPAERRDRLGGATGVRGGNPDHALRGRHQGVGAEPTDMTLAKHRDGGDVALLRLLDGELHPAPWTKTPRLPIYSRNTKPRLRRWSAWLAAKRSKSSSYGGRWTPRRGLAAA